jgi:hypothetical protein
MRKSVTRGWSLERGGERRDVIKGCSFSYTSRINFNELLYSMFTTVNNNVFFKIPKSIDINIPAKNK